MPHDKKPDLIILLTILLGTILSTASAEPWKSNESHTDPSEPERLYYEGNANGRQRSQPHQPSTIFNSSSAAPMHSVTATSQLSGQGATFVVKFLGDWTQEQMDAVNYAADIWADTVYSSVPIEIEVEWDPNIFGMGYSDFYETLIEDKPYAPFKDTYYVDSLINSLAGVDLDPDLYDGHIRFRSNQEWYFRIDGQTPLNQLDFVSIVLHEIGHCLLGSDSFYVDDSHGLGKWGFPGPVIDTRFPTNTDNFIKNSSGQQLIDTTQFPNPSEALYEQLTNSDLFFSGPYTLANNNNQGGMLNRESLSHLNDIYQGTPNGLMTASIGNGEVNHQIGPITLGMLQDLGWKVIANTSPIFAPLPNILAEANMQTLNILDLWLYASDTQSDPSNLSYTILSNSAPQAGVTLRDNRFLDLNPQAGWSGTTHVEIQAEDPQGLSSKASFNITVVDKLYKVRLPFVVQELSKSSE